MMKLSTIRSIARWMHILEGAFIVAFFYSPLGGLPLAKVIITWFMLPAIIISGLWMWKGHLLYKNLLKK